MSIAPIILAAALGQANLVPDNIDFRKGTLESWEGSGFYLTGNGGPSLELGVCSSDAGNPKRQGTIRYVFTVPKGVGMIRFSAFAAHGKDCDPDTRIDVVLAGENERIIPKKLRTESGWTAAPRLLPRWAGKPRDYCWDVSALAGQRLQIVLLDQDDRPGCFLYCGGFAFQKGQQFQDLDFAQHMVDLTVKHHLNPMARYDSKRFTAISNAGEDFTALRLRNCEIFYDLFFLHFQQKGFKTTLPTQRLMIAVFDNHAGFDAYMGQKMPAGVAGLYHTPTNRLVLFDLGENRAWVAAKNKQLKDNLKSGKIISATIERKFGEAVQDANLSTTMHECAHQLSFNCGMFNREGDAPSWIVEGFATYCESTDQGDWQSFGSPNPLRINDLVNPVKGRGQFIPLETLVKSDQWLRHPAVLQGYAQSWALFRLLLEERPRDLRRYMALIYPRRAPDHRLDDFRQIFGPDLAALERRYHQYMGDLVKNHAPKAMR